MKKRLSFGRLAVVVALAVLCGLAAGALFRGIRGETLREHVASAFTSCAEPTKEFDYNCLRTAMTPLVREDTLTPVMEHLHDIFSSPDVSLQTHGALTCHPSGHVAGEIAAEKHIAFSRITQLCGASCDYGCTHGAFVVTLRRDPGFLDRVGTLCDELSSSGIRRQMSSCGHVVGHGLAEVFASNTDKALGYCDALDDASARHACGQGVMMEQLIGLPDRPKNIPLSLESVLVFCDSLPGVYKKECFDNVGTYAGRITQTVQEAKDVCTHVPAESAVACVQSLGGVVYYHFRHEPEQMSAYCRSMDSAVQAPCVRGVLETSVGEKDRLWYGNALCRTFAQSARRDCFAYFGIQVGMAWGDQVRADTCSALEKEDMQACQL